MKFMIKTTLRKDSIAAFHLSKETILDLASRMVRPHEFEFHPSIGGSNVFQDTNQYGGIEIQAQKTLGTQSIAEIIALVCRILGLNFDQF